MPGRTPQEAFRVFVDPLAKALSCVAQCKLTPSPGGQANTDGEHNLLGNGGDKIPLGGPNHLSLGLRMRYQFVHDEALQNGPWKIGTLAYSYTITDDADTGIISFHWHPGGGSHVISPHAHLGGTQLSDTAVLTSKQHLPTGRVSLEQVIRVLIAEYGVPPRCDDWDARLTLTHGLFELYRTWS